MVLSAGLWWCRGWGLRRSRILVNPRLARGSRRGGVQGGDSEDVVDGAGHEEPGSVPGSAVVAKLASSGDGLDPAEGFLDPPTDPLTRLMADPAAFARFLLAPEVQRQGKSLDRRFNGPRR